MTLHDPCIAYPYKQSRSALRPTQAKEYYDCLQLYPQCIPVHNYRDASWPYCGVPYKTLYSCTN